MERVIPEVLPGEGQTKLVRKEMVRIPCGNCGENATMKFTYLLPNYRRNPASKAYGRDDCTWCSDYALYGCKTCYPSERPPKVEGYTDASTFFAVEPMGHMFLKWKETEVKS